MLRALEAMIDERGNVRLLEPIHVPMVRRALVIIEDEPATGIPARTCGAGTGETALLSEAALGEDWNRPEEDTAWSHLQQVLSS